MRRPDVIQDDHDHSQTHEAEHDGGVPARAGFGLRRLLIDEARNPKGELGRGDRKSLQTDRVVLIPGPIEEIEHEHSIYSMFVEDGKSESEIALEFNRRGILSDLGRPWTRASIHQILTNEKYIGNNIFNRVSYKLKQRRVVNRRDTWVRANGVFPSIVDRALFERARVIIDQRGPMLMTPDERAMVAGMPLFSNTHCDLK